MYATIRLFLHTQGKVEMELEIVTLEEEQLRPAGMGRSEPNMNPKLDPPKLAYKIHHALADKFYSRPSTSFLWFTSPWRTFKFIIWKNFKWHIIFSIVAVFVILLIIIFIYNTPVSNAGNTIYFIINLFFLETLGTILYGAHSAVVDKT